MINNTKQNVYANYMKKVQEIFTYKWKYQNGKIGTKQDRGQYGTKNNTEHQRGRKYSRNSEAEMGEVTTAAQLHRKNIKIAGFFFDR